jgi:hypothetical protein
MLFGVNFALSRRFSDVQPFGMGINFFSKDMLNNIKAKSYE